MESAAITKASRQTGAQGPALPQSLRRLAPGILSALGLAFIAHGLGKAFPIIGGSIFGILLGVAVRNIVGLDASLSPGVTFTGKKILQASIVLLGAILSLSQAWRTGTESLGVMLISLATGLLVSLAVGKYSRVPWRLASLIGAGTSICGASAIAAVAPVVAAEEDEVAYSISTVFLFNIAAVFLFPLLGHLLGLQDKAFGLWAGTAINDTSSVVASGFAWSTAAGEYATIVKLARSTMIVPVAMAFAGWAAFKGSRAESSVKWQKIVPWFIFGFLGMALLNTIGLLGGTGPWLGSIAKFGITLALVGVGLGADFGKIRATGLRPLVLGLITWGGVALTSILQILFAK